MQQYFTDQELTLDQPYYFDKDQSHHLLKVLRVKEGQQVRLVDAKGQVFLAELSFSKHELSARLLETLEEKRELPLEVELGLAHIKKDAFELALQKTTELGITSIVPLETEWTQRHKIHQPVKRWQRYESILREAAEQSERHQIPSIQELTSLEEYLAFDQAPLLICAERSFGRSPHILDQLEQMQADATLIESGIIRLLVGPEGGFSPQELDLAATFDHVFFVSLGARILRAETAAMSAVNAIAMQFEKIN